MTNYPFGLLWQEACECLAHFCIVIVGIHLLFGQSVKGKSSRIPEQFGQREAESPFREYEAGRDARKGKQIMKVYFALCLVYWAHTQILVIQDVNWTIPFQMTARKEVCYRKWTYHWYPKNSAVHFTIELAPVNWRMAFWTIQCSVLGVVLTTTFVR